MFVALLTLVASGIAFWMARTMRAEVRRTRDWPTVPGQILERGVGEPMGSGRTYLPHVKYTYTIDEKEYTNDQVYVIRRTGNLADSVQKLVDGLPNPVPVHYDPKSPEQSYLLSNPIGTLWILVMFGVGAFVMGILELLVAVVPTK